MNTKQMERLTAHFDRYFEQDDCLVLHNDSQNPHIDVLLYKPTEKYPFWKLATMGASDCKLPDPGNELGNRNEYVMFVDKDTDLSDKQTNAFFCDTLLNIAYYPIQNEDVIFSYAHSLEWGEIENSDMVGAFLEFPQAIDNSGILHCKLGFCKQATVLQVVLLTRKELNRLRKIGPQAFSYYLYPEKIYEKKHFLSERLRTENF